MSPTPLAVHARVLTFKEGLLSPIAHDLELEMRKLSLSLKDGKVEATFWPATLEVVGVRRGPRLLRSVLTAADRAKIARNVRDEVLRTRRFAEATFRGEIGPSGESVDGELTLAGQTARLQIWPRHLGGQVQVRVEIQPSRHGVKPYRAMAGTLRVQDRVTIELDLEWPDDVSDPRAAELAWAREP